MLLSASSTSQTTTPYTTIWKSMSQYETPTTTSLFITEESLRLLGTKTMVLVMWVWHRSIKDTRIQLFLDRLSLKEILRSNLDVNNLTSILKRGVLGFTMIWLLILMSELELSLEAFTRVVGLIRQLCSVVVWVFLWFLLLMVIHHRHHHHQHFPLVIEDVAVVLSLQIVMPMQELDM